MRQALMHARFVRFQSTKQNTAAYKEWIKVENWKIPSLLGFAVIGSIQWYHLTHEKNPQPADLLSRLPEKKTAVEQQMVSERQFQALKMFPYRIASRVWGMMHDISLYVVVGVKFS